MAIKRKKVAHQPAAAASRRIKNPFAVWPKFYEEWIFKQCCKHGCTLDEKQLKAAFKGTLAERMRKIEQFSHERGVTFKADKKKGQYTFELKDKPVDFIYTKGHK